MSSYQKEVLKKYHREKGGEMISYLASPTRRQIRQACMWLVDKRNSDGDKHILDIFFKFSKGESMLQKIQNIDGDKFLPIINFLKGKTMTTSPQNVELISWLIDFQPRPFHMYLKVPKAFTNQGLFKKKENKVILNGNNMLFGQNIGHNFLLDKEEILNGNIKEHKFTISITMQF